MDVIVDGVSFNAASFLQQIREGLTEQEFVARGFREGKYIEYSDDDRITLLKMAYDEIKRSGE